MSISKFFLLTLVVFILGLVRYAFAQEVGTEEIMELHAEYNKHMEIKDYQNAIKKLEEIEQYGYFLEIISFEKAEIFALLGDKQKMYESLQRALEEGGTFFTEMDTVEALKPYRNEKKFRFIYNEMREQTLFVEMLEYNNAPVTGYEELPVFDDPSSELSKRLRKKYKLKKIIESGKDEKGKIMLITNWVHSRWKHGQEIPSHKDALTILKEAEQGHRFRCVEYAITLSQCLQALGYPAREVDLKMRNHSYGYGKGHVVVEVWSNQFKKWFVVDPENNGYWVVEVVKDVPLNAAELQPFVTGHVKERPHFVGYLNSMSEEEENDWLKYFNSFVVFTRNDIFTKGDIIKGENRIIELLPPGQNPELLFQTFEKNNYYYSYNPSFIYPKLNMVHIYLSYEIFDKNKREIVYKATLRNTMPWFDHYLLKIDDEEWREIKQDTIIWKLKQGKNRIEVIPVNQFGIKGIKSKIVVEKL